MFSSAFAFIHNRLKCIVCGIILQEYEFELACFPESDCLHQKLLTHAMQSRKKKGKERSSARELGCGDFPWSVELLYCLKCIYTHTPVTFVWWQCFQLQQCRVSLCVLAVGFRIKAPF